MEKNKEGWLRISNKMLSGALALLGFTACDPSKAADEYGMPYADYEIKGKVTNQAGEELDKIRVIVKELPDNPYVRKDTLYTKVGVFDFKSDRVTNSGKYRVICEDLTDVYKTDSADVQMKPEGGEHWYQGSDYKEVAFELEETAANGK